MHTLKTTVFKGAKGQEITNEQFMTLMDLVDQYQLNPFTKEIYAYPDKSGGVVPVLGVDGWLRLMNSHPAMNGVTYNYSENNIQLTGMKSECYEWVECVIYRKDRVNPIVVREYLDEAYRPQGNSPVPGPWQIYTRRMLRHRATIQAIRTAFSYSGLYDEDTAQDILNSQEIDGGIVREVVKNPMVKPGVVLGNRLDKFIEDMLQRLPQVGYQQAMHYAATRTSDPKELEIISQKLMLAQNAISTTNTVQ